MSASLVGSEMCIRDRRVAVRGPDSLAATLGGFESARRRERFVPVEGGGGAEQASACIWHRATETAREGGRERAERLPLRVRAEAA
eukprot:9560180-Alexandrium_andersonii.AAC.1